MFKSSEIIVGLEIGTSKVCAIVGEMNTTGSLNIIGIGQCPSHGVRKGEIIDPTLASADIRNAIVEAEQRADVEIRSVYLGITGNHIQGFNNRGVHTMVPTNREITEEDVQDVIKNAKAMNLPEENHVIHAIRQHFTVDDQEGVVNPEGMLGTKMEVDMHVVHGKRNRLQNPIRAVKALQLDVENVVFTGLASALALLSNEQKELGALVIDFGGGSTEYVVYADGVVKHTGVLAVGSDHLSNDLAIGLKIPLHRAEQLKLDQGRAVLDDGCKGQTITLKSELALPEKSINLEHLRRIMHLRLEETLQIIEQRLAEASLLEYLRAGIVLCGGGARIPQLPDLVRSVFHLPASLGKTTGISGLTAALDQPEFAAAIGLAKFGSLQNKQQPGGNIFKRVLSDIFRGD